MTCSSPLSAKATATKTIRNCRVCGSADITQLYSLGDIYISDFVAKTNEGLKAPLAMVMCRHCSLVQLRHTAPQDFLYTRFYWYRSGVTDTMRMALRDITRDIEERIPLRPGDIVLDIGSNDGTMLRTYREQQLVKVGVEPASNLAEEGKQGLQHFINDFWTYESFWDTVGKKARIITAIGMFYDMEDPNQFIRDAAHALDDDGVFVAQLMCLKNMIDMNDVGNICHEHLEYYSLSALEFLFDRNGLRPLDIEYNGTNGGSYRVFAGLKEGNPPQMHGARERLETFRNAEKGLASQQMHEEFFRRVERNKKECVEFIRAEVRKGKRVWVYGASTKGNTILQYYGLDHALIEGASEKSPEKWGKYTVGTAIPIVSEEEARKANPDYFLVLPYAFFEEFYVREAEWRRKGGKFLVPLPTFRIVA